MPPGPTGSRRPGPRPVVAASAVSRSFRARSHVRSSSAKSRSSPVRRLRVGLLDEESGPGVDLLAVGIRHPPGGHAHRGTLGQDADARAWAARLQNDAGARSSGGDRFGASAGSEPRPAAARPRARQPERFAAPGQVLDRSSWARRSRYSASRFRSGRTGPGPRRRWSRGPGGRPRSSGRPDHRRTGRSCRTRTVRISPSYPR